MYPLDPVLILLAAVSVFLLIYVSYVHATAGAIFGAPGRMVLKPPKQHFA
jgi:hypothetical protein